MPNQIRAFVFGALLVGLMLAAAQRREAYAQSLDAVVAQSVARVARQAGQPARRFDLTLDAAVQRALERNGVDGQPRIAVSTGHNASRARRFVDRAAPVRASPS